MPQPITDKVLSALKELAEPADTALPPVLPNSQA